MNEALFRSMQEQLRPSGEARAALMEKLARAKKKTVPVGRYVAIAACAAVIVAAVPVYRAVQNRYEWRTLLSGFERGTVVEPFRPHSYASVKVPAEDCLPGDTGAPEHNTVTGGGGDRDQDMTPGELADNMLEAGLSQEDVDAYLASGWQMTWAKWWKFYHMAEESGDWTLEALLDFSREEKLAVNTGEAPIDIPGGAYIGDAPDQSEAIMAYQNLMDRFKADYGPDRYPAWYGGAYIDEHAGLIVNIVRSEEPEGKELFFQIWDWAGSERVGFGSSELSLNDLRSLQRETEAAMEDLGMDFGCGVDEETGRVELTLYRYSEEALWKLAELDPADTAIDVRINDMADMVPTDGPAPSVSHSVQPGGTPGAAVNGAAEEEETGVIAWEPQG